ncbi:uncharacterized protein LOC116232981 isoform X2 [Phasianus colchicus]|uniref:uncharacterized protein LOC116232981 isoform X2 n=1 Tax=Phasianus colchicus TaxID=9054 RepID=UPI00129E0F4B|nr:uncharacterized protein LOC116232981 isoform X2 [Phasianus colchicus]
MLGVLVVLPPSRVPRMIVSLWMAYIAARKGTGVHTATDENPDGPAVEFDAFSMGEEQVSWLFRRMLETWTGLWGGQRAEPQAEPQEDQQAELQAQRTAAPPASPHLSSPSSQDDANVEAPTSEQVVLKDRVHIFTWSKACCVHHISSMLENEETENRLEQTENDMPQQLLQDMPDQTMDAADAAARAMTHIMTDTNIQFNFPSKK